jgi:FkbM family methyltransferase
MNKRFKHFVAQELRLCRKTCRRALFHLHGLLHETVTIRTKQGRLTVFTKDDGIGASLFLERKYEYDYSINVIQFLKSAGYIPASNVGMLDVGANIGLISIGLILADEVGMAIAIEPEPYNFKLLQKNIEQNGLAEKMRGLQVAVGDKISILDMELSPNNRSDHRMRQVPTSDAREHLRESNWPTIQVKSLPLPQVLELPEVRDFGLSSPSLMWIDVQGYEGYVFRGGESSLKRGLPTVSEIWPYGILRAGMSLKEFSKIVSSIWTDYWVERRGRFTRYPVAVFDCYLEELGVSGHFENVIFTKNSPLL